jgi:hypothetical protein
MRRRAVTWLAWSLVALSVALLVVGLSLARMTRCIAPEIPYGSEADPGSVVSSLVTLLTFSVVGAIVASRHPRNAIGWIFCGVSLISRLQQPRRGLRRVLARRRFRPRKPRRDGSVVLVVVVEPPGVHPHEFPAALVPRRSAAFAPLAARGLVRGARNRGLRRRLCAGGLTARGLPAHRKPLRCRQPHRDDGGGCRCHLVRGLHGCVCRLAHR